MGDTLSSSSITSTESTTVLTNKLRIVTSEVVIPLSAVYTTVYTYSGSGKLTGFDLQFTKSGATVKLTIDGTEVIFEDNVDTIENIGSSKVVNGIPLIYDSSKNVLTFSSVFPLLYTASVLIEAKNSGAGGAADLSGYLISLTQES